jgi:hypothetical protein
MLQCKMYTGLNGMLQTIMGALTETSIIARS